MISMALMAFMGKDHVFRTAGHVASGFNDQESKKLFSWAQKNKVDEDDTYVWVKPQKIMEIQYERTTLKEMPAYKYSKGKYEKVNKLMSGTIVKPRFIRWRTDKSATPSDLRLEQIPDWNKRNKMATKIASNFLQALTPSFETGIKKQDPDEKLKYDRWEYDTIADETAHPLRFSLSDLLRSLVQNA
jgi:hypothetical protein